MAVVLDSDSVVGLLDRGDALHEAADAAIRKLAESEPLKVSAVTFAEVMTGARLGHHDEEHVAGFFATVVSRVLPVDLGVADRAADLRAQHRGLRMPDALIAATADLDTETEILLSGDSDGDSDLGKLSGLSCEVQLLT